MVKHFWIKDPETRSNSYCVNINGFLLKLGDPYTFVALNYKEVLDIINKKTKEEKYIECGRIFDTKYPQPDEDKNELSKKEQSQLEGILSTHKNL